MSGPLRLLVFDVDGTLVDSRANILDAMRRAFDDVGLAPPSDQEILRHVGLSLPDMMAGLAPEQSVAVRDTLVGRYKARFFEQHTSGESREAPFFPGLRAVLDHFRSDDFTLMSVATGKSRRGLDRLIAHHGLAGYFQSLQVADNHPSKPHPSMIQTALAETGVEARHAVMIGDTGFDMAMGKAAGLSTVGVSWGYHDRTALLEADIIVDTAEQLIDTLNVWRDHLR